MIVYREFVESMRAMNDFLETMVTENRIWVHEDVINLRIFRCGYMFRKKKFKKKLHRTISKKINHIANKDGSERTRNSGGRSRNLQSTREKWCFSLYLRRW